MTKLHLLVSLFVLAVLAPAALARSTVTCSRPGHQIILSVDQFSDTINYNGMLFDWCKRTSSLGPPITWVHYECPNNREMKYITLWINLEDGKPVTGQFTFEHYIAGPNNPVTVGPDMPVDCR